MGHKAELAAASINDLPDSAFAYIEPGGSKDSSGKTTPRSLRHFPIHDKAHVRNAMARAGQSPFGKEAMPKIMAAAKRMGIGDNAGKATELKAEPMDTAQLERWLMGKIPRRTLVAPFFGSLKAGLFGYPEDGKGRDLDGEYFHPEDSDGPATDFYGPYPSLRSTRQRAVDWHHVTFSDNVDPIGNAMKGAVIGHIVLDDATENDGLWADFWANAGEKRRKLIADLEMRGNLLYGSSQPVGAGIVKGKAGRIDVWPIRYHTISTSPQNLAAVTPPLKALLTASSLDELPAEAVKAMLVGLDADQLRLRKSFSDGGSGFRSGGGGVGKAGRVLAKRNEARVLAVIELMEEFLTEHRNRLAPPIPEGEDT